MICPTCWGDGVITVCLDDLCINSDHCIHGDGEETCPDCDGWGEVAGDDDDDEDWWYPDEDEEYWGGDLADLIAEMYEEDEG